MILEIEINNHEFVLHNSGALYWKGQEMLLVSDVHLGKISHFRKHGSALPTQPIFKVSSTSLWTILPRKKSVFWVIYFIAQ